VEAAGPFLPVGLERTDVGRPPPWIPSRAHLRAARVGFHEETVRQRCDHPTMSVRTDEGTRDGTASLAIHLASPSARRVAFRPAAPFARSWHRESVRDLERVSELGFGRGRQFCSLRMSRDRRIVTDGRNQVGRRSGPGGRGTFPTQVVAWHTGVCCARAGWPLLGCVARVGRIKF
jgi:hypothetical protein